MKRVTVLEIISFLFVALFVYASVSKLIDYDRFITQLGMSPLINTKAVYVGWSVLMGELITSCLLIFSKTRIIGLYLSFSFMMSFTLYIIGILLLNNPDSIPCTCGGLLEELSWTQHIVFNLFMTLVSLLGIYIDRRERQRLNGVQIV